MHETPPDLGRTSLILTFGERPAEPAGPAEPPARDLPRYRQLGRLGEGGFGVVDRVWDVDLMRELAVKRLRADAGPGSDGHRRFLCEARVTASLDHPNIVPVHDLGRTGRGELFFTMKRLRGRTLRQLIDGLAAGDAQLRERYPMARRLRAFLQVLAAVAAAHARGVLHRDLKPDNVMLGELGEVVVMDWGLACTTSGADEDLRGLFLGAEERGVSGTPAYMSPEQAAGDALDTRSDVFSLGLILYELAALEPAYQATSVSELLSQAREARLRPLAEVAPEVSDSLRAIIACATARAPDRRYASATALAEDIERYLDGLVPRAQEANLARRILRWYFHRDPRFSKLRVIDVDLLMLGSGFIGAAIAIWLAPWVARLAWPSLGVGAAMIGYGVHRWICWASKEPR